MILILSNKWDVTVDFVVRKLQEVNHPYLRLNTEELPNKNITTKLPEFSITLEDEENKVEIDEEINVIWYRRPGKPFEFKDDSECPDKETLEYIEEQWSAWLQSLQAIPDITWVNHPITNHKMESKIFQLRLADELGFNIPYTVISNSINNLSNIFERHKGEVISKALSSPLIAQENQENFVFTTLLKDFPSKDEDRLKICPTIFQEPLLPKTDYRVTIVGNDIFSVKILGEESNSVPVDWRTEKEDIRFVQEDLPRNIEKLCLEYVDKAGLYFGAIDLVKVNDEFIFLEINPNGEWGWLQKTWDVPIAESLTNLLIKHDN